MAKQRKDGMSPVAPPVTVPRGTLARIDIGRSFAEYDPLLMKANIFVETPAIRAAVESGRSKCFFVGRRGTGKTAITYALNSRFPKRTTTLLPQIFTELGRHFQLESLKDSRQRHFKSLVMCFKRALADEVVNAWVRAGLFSFNRSQGVLSRERNVIEDLDFDFRLITFVEDVFKSLDDQNEREWLRQINRTKDILTDLNSLREDDRWDHTLLIDRIDESWDGSDKAVILLSALMHACVEVTAASGCIRPLLFLRENIFERVRENDQEFARLETFVVSLDWSRELLLELIERRLNNSLTAKLQLRGPTWDAFFEQVESNSSQDIIFNYCQYRPRDVLTYCTFAIESAQQRKSELVSIRDLQAARRRFSDNRLKDLGDEYAENYPQIQLVFSRFFGLGRQFTVAGLEAFIKKLLVDDEIKRSCATWIYRHTQPDAFIHLFYDLGFFGLRSGPETHFRSAGADVALSPPITTDTMIEIHPSYSDALSLQDVIVGSLDPDISLRTAGIIIELPGAIDVTAYTEQLQNLRENLQTLPPGNQTDAQYEELVGNVIRLCFFKTLGNVASHVRNYNGRVVRDWIASNMASGGFWQMILQRYGATQVIWECKNYVDLDATAFHQAAYYMTREVGRFAIICFRGETKKGYYEHIKRVASEKDGGVILLVGDRDLDVFLRQAINMKAREAHIREIYDRTVREIS